MPYIRVSVDQSYQKKRCPREQKEQQVRQKADEIFAALFSRNAKKTDRQLDLAEHDRL